MSLIKCDCVGEHQFPVSLSLCISMVVDLDVDKDVPMPYFVHACSFRQISVRMYIYTRKLYVYIWVYSYYIHMCMDGLYQCLRVCRRECMLLFVCLFVCTCQCMPENVCVQHCEYRTHHVPSDTRASLSPDRNHPPAVR